MPEEGRARVQRIVVRGVRRCSCGTYHSETDARPYFILAAKSRNPRDMTEDRFFIEPHRFSRLVRRVSKIVLY